MEFLRVFLISCIPAVLAGVIVYFTAKKKAAADLEALKAENRLNTERLTEQHKADLEQLREQHAMEMERLETEHRQKLELLQKERENEEQRRKEEQEDTEKYGPMGSIFAKLFGNLGDTLSSPEVKEELKRKIIESINNPQEDGEKES